MDCIFELLREVGAKWICHANVGNQPFAEKGARPIFCVVVKLIGDAGCVCAMWVRADDRSEDRC